MKIGSRTRKILVPLALSAMLLNACATEEEPAEEITEKPADEASETSPEGTSEALSVAVTAKDYAFEGLPASIAVGTTLKLKNVSTKELHELAAFKLADSEKRSAAELFKLPEADLEKVTNGPPVTVIIAKPGGEGMPVLGDGSLKEAGRYLVSCFIPTGANPEEYLKAAEAATDGPPEVAGGPPHFTQGMFSEVTVK